MLIIIFTLLANVYFKYLPESIAVVEGEKLTIHCRAFGTNPRITWIVGKINIFGLSLLVPYRSVQIGIISFTLSRQDSINFFLLFKKWYLSIYLGP